MIWQHNATEGKWSDRFVGAASHITRYLPRKQADYSRISDFGRPHPRDTLGARYRTRSGNCCSTVGKCIWFHNEIQKKWHKNKMWTLIFSFSFCVFLFVNFIIETCKITALHHCLLMCGNLCAAAKSFLTELDDLMSAFIFIKKHQFNFKYKHQLLANLWFFYTIRIR